MPRNPQKCWKKKKVKRENSNGFCKDYKKAYEVFWGASKREHEQNLSGFGVVV